MKKVFLIIGLTMALTSCNLMGDDLEPEPIIIGWNCITQIYYVRETPKVPLGVERFESFSDQTGMTQDGSRVTYCSPIYSE